MASDALLAFTALDELIQLIYQGASRFVVISRVDDHAWTLHVGLSASGSAADGRWWRGRWTAEDILGAVGTKSSTVQERFADGLRDAFVGGQLHIENWSSHADRGVQINLAFNPSSKNPTRVGLEELSPEEAAAAAASTFTAIALRAQSHKCQLYPSAATSLATATYTPTLPSTTAAPSKRKASASQPTDIAQDKEKEAPEALPPKANAPTDELDRLKSRLASAPRAAVQVKPKKSVVPATSSRAPRGASLANPNKKARKVQAIEFESDEE